MSKKDETPKQECCDLESCCVTVPKLLRQAADAIEKCCAPKPDTKER